MRQMSKSSAAWRAEHAPALGTNELTARWSFKAGVRGVILLRFAVFVVGSLDVGGFGVAAVDPDAVTTGDWLARFERFGFDARPADGEHTVLARHPFGREVGVI